MTVNYSEFPNLRGSQHCLTSEPRSGENCVAHAIGARGEWWQPATGRFWPVGPPYYNCRIESLVYVFERQGFAVCDSPEYESGYEKIAIYGNDGEWKHAARQLTEDGTWTSKLGPEDDINHATLEALAEGTYGTVVRIMKRQQAGQKDTRCCEAEDVAV